jgi:hypothetical protein
VPSAGALTPTLALPQDPGPFENKRRDECRLGRMLGRDRTAGVQSESHRKDGLVTASVAVREERLCIFSLFGDHGARGLVSWSRMAFTISCLCSAALADQKGIDFSRDPRPNIRRR